MKPQFQNTPSRNRILEYIKSEVATRGQFPRHDEIKHHMKYKSIVSVHNALAGMAKRGMLARKLNDRNRIVYSLPSNRPETKTDHTLKFIVQEIDMFHGFPSRERIREWMRIDGQAVNIILANLKQRGDIDTETYRKGRYKYFLTDAGRDRVEMWWRASLK